VIFWRNPNTGLVEALDESGRVVSVQKSLDAPFDANTKQGFSEQTRPDGTTIWVQDGVDGSQSKSWMYNEMLGAVIAGEIASGARISTLHAKNPDYPPYAILCRWMNKNADFKEMMEQAVKDRALVHFERILTEAEASHERNKTGEDDVAATKVLLDALKFTTEKGDRDKYGTKPSNLGEGNVTILIQTGIVRDEPREVTQLPIAKPLEIPIPVAAEAPVKKGKKKSGRS